MPADDPASHQYMQVVDGKKGWSHWDDNGERIGLENPAWVGALTDYVDVAQDDAIKLNVDSALQLAYMHSPAQQTQLETLYLSALDVTAERFRLDTQFFGGYDAKYEHLGSLIPPALRYDPVLGRYVVTPPIHGAGVENNRVTVGRPFGADPASRLVGVSRRRVNSWSGSPTPSSLSSPATTRISPHRWPIFRSSNRCCVGPAGM